MTDYSNKRKADCLIENPTDGDDGAAAFEMLSNIVSEHIKTSNERMERLEEAFFALVQKVDDCTRNMNSADDEDDDISDDEESVVEERDQWSKMFRLLRDYRITNGNCKVSANENKKLCTWIRNQKSCYMNSKMGKQGTKLSTEKVAKLDSIGFSWGSKYPPPQTWDEMFEKLENHRQTFKNCEVKYNPTNPTPLAKWVAAQRKEYKNYKYGRPSLITLDQIGRLKDVGLKWKGPKL